MNPTENTSDQNAPAIENFSFVETEHKILKFWKDENIFKKSLDNTKKKRPYIFYDGPPFATGLPHHGHLIGSTLKDIVPRYWTMKGRYVERRFGWDCHGLPIEHEIDKKLGMSAQEAVAKFGVKGYNDECRSIVSRYVSEWEKTITRIGRWVDFENDYKTMDASFMESVWWVFKELWDKDLIYLGTRVVPFSTALGTVLSNFEAGSNYQDVQDPAVTVLFKLENEDNYIAAWTTTPWTLPSNLALCVGADIDYVLVHDADKNISFYIAKARLESISKKRNLTVTSECKGSSLKGKKYQPLFPFFAAEEKNGAFVILNDAYVTTDNGTGVVHLAPAFGEDDNRVMKEAGITSIVCPVDDAGKFTAAVTTYNSIYVKDADKLIIKDLKDNNHLYEQSTIVHSYPFCPRSDTPLIYKVVPAWYVSVEKIKDDLIAANKEINWVPDNIKEGRFGQWLENARDWNISRNRIWGTPLPIWKNNKTGKFICMGSIADLKKYSGTELTDLHREFVDPLKFTVAGEEGSYERIPEVLDCWFESGSMPYAQMHYPFENAEIFKDGFPAEFIAEGLDQTRGWFYTLTVLSSALFKKPAFKNVIVNGIVTAADGKKMSKRLKNYTPPDILMENYGADALRLYLINSGLVRAEEQRFADASVKEMVRRALLPWYNSFKFFTTYAQVDGWSPVKDLAFGDNITDRWIISKLQTLKKNISHEMEAYRLYNVVPQLFNFIEELTNTYIRLNRSRFWGEGLSPDKKHCYSTLYTALSELCLTMAPFAPFLAEHIYLELKKLGGLKEASVHLCQYPEAIDNMINAPLEDAIDRMNQVILLGRQKRNQVSIKVKTPLSRLTVIHKETSVLNEIKKLENYLKIELNIKTVEYSTDEEAYIKLFAKPNSPVLGKRLGKDFGRFRGLIENLKAKDLSTFDEKGSLTIDGITFSGDDLLIYREAKEGTMALSNRFISIDLDCNLDQNLIDEGLAREVVNRIQKTRKDLNFNVADRIVIDFTATAALSSAIEKHREYICGETLAVTLNAKTSLTGSVFDFEVDEDKISITLKKA